MKKLFVIGILCLLAACVWTSPSSQFYTMRTMEAAGAPVISKSFQASIGVEQVKVPYMLDRPQIVVVKENEIEVSISERHRWAEPLSIIIQRKLAGDMSIVLPNAQIRNKNYALEKFDRSVIVEISKLDATLGDKVSLEAWYTISDASGKILARKKYALTEPVGTTYEDLVSVTSNMIQALAVEIAQTVSKTK